MITLLVEELLGSDCMGVITLLGEEPVGVVIWVITLMGEGPGCVCMDNTAG